MKKKPAAQSAFFNPRFLISFAFCSVGLFLMLAFAAYHTPALAQRYKEAQTQAASKSAANQEVAETQAPVRFQLVSNPNQPPPRDPLVSQRFGATMSGAQEVPPNGSAGTGFGTVVLNAAETMITVNLSFSGLTTPATDGHIHTAPAGVSGPVTFPFSGVPAATSGSIPEQSFAITPAQVATLRAGGMYFNIHTSTVPAGEIRGQIALNTTAFASEVEPNDTTATAQALGSLSNAPLRLRGDLFKAPFVAGGDIDVYSFTAAAGDRVYAATNTLLAATGASTDTLVDIIGTDGTTVLETDDDDGSFSGTSSVVAGTVLPSAGTYFIRVRPFGVADNTGSIRPYELFARVRSGAPTAETEPNEVATPQVLPASGWASGVVGAAAGDNDSYTFTANAGDTIMAIVDGEPERDAVFWNPRVGLAPFNNFILNITGSGASTATNPAARGVFHDRKDIGHLSGQCG